MPDPPRLGDKLTERELDVMVALVEYSSYARAAKALGIGNQTVKNYVTNVVKKLGAQTRTHATWMLWPILNARFVIHGIKMLPRDRRSGHARRNRGQGLAEYALVLALIAIVAIIALIFLGNQVSAVLSAVGESI